MAFWTKKKTDEESLISGSVTDRNISTEGVTVLTPGATGSTTRNDGGAKRSEPPAFLTAGSASIDRPTINGQTVSGPAVLEGPGAMVGSTHIANKGSVASGSQVAPQHNASSKKDAADTSASSVGNFDDVSAYGRVRSALGPGTVIQGKLSFDTPVRIDGKLSGEIFSSQAIIVGDTGVIDGEVKVQELIIAGLVKGRLKVRGRLVIKAGGRLEGDFVADRFIVEEGGSFTGHCSMIMEPTPTVVNDADALCAAESSSGLRSNEVKKGARGSSLLYPKPGYAKPTPANAPSGVTAQSASGISGTQPLTDIDANKAQLQ